MTTDAVDLRNSTSPGAPDRVGAGLSIKGELQGNQDLIVEGVVEGPIHLADHTLTIGSGGNVSSDVVAREIVVHGRIKGNLRATGRIEIKKDGSVIGDLTTACILIEDGASVKGSIEIDPEAAAAEPGKATRARAATATGQARSGDTK